MIKRKTMSRIILITIILMIGLDAWATTTKLLSLEIDMHFWSSAFSIVFLSWLASIMLMLAPQDFKKEDSQ